MGVEVTASQDVFARPLTPGESLWHFSLCQLPYSGEEREISYESKLEKFGRRASRALPRLTSPNRLFFYTDRQKARLLKEGGELPIGKLDREAVLTFYARMWGVNMQRLFDPPEKNQSARLEGIWRQLTDMDLTLPQGVTLAMQMQTLEDFHYPNLVFPHPQYRVGGVDTFTWDELD